MPGFDFADEFNVYPNPHGSLFNISFGSIPINQAELRIYKLQGRIMGIEKLQKTTSGRFNKSGLPKGIYMVK